MTMDRQSLRETYKQLVNDAKKYVEDSNMDGIVQICSEMKKIYNEVKHTREAILDITLMNHLANFSYKKIQTIETNFIYFDPKAFVQKLLDCDRETIRKDFCRVAYAPSVPFIYVNNSINVESEQPIRKRRSVHLDQNGITQELVKVSKVHGHEVDSNITDENNFSLNIIRIYDMIEEYVKDGHVPVYLSDVLARAKDFSQADGRIKMDAKSSEISDITLEPTEEGPDSTEPRSNMTSNNTNLKKSQYQQLVIPLCYNTWKVNDSLTLLGYPKNFKSNKLLKTTTNTATII